MALVSMRQLLDHAAEHNYGIPAFNVNNLEQIQAIMMAADEVNAPVILQASAGARTRSVGLRSQWEQPCDRYNGGHHAFTPHFPYPARHL